QKIARAGPLRRAYRAHLLPDWPTRIRKTPASHCDWRGGNVIVAGNGNHRGEEQRVNDLAPLLRIDGLTKAYPGVVANADVGFSVQPGRIHALLGENGAGKSTLVKMIYGLVRPDSGTMQLRGAP